MTIYLPSDAYPEYRPKTCQHCKHWGEIAIAVDMPPLFQECQNPTGKMLGFDNEYSDWDAPVATARDFGCTLWEAKDDTTKHPR